MQSQAPLELCRTRRNSATQLRYDAWGRLRNPATQVAYTSGTEPALFIGRGYTGHSLPRSIIGEHLPWFGLVNMNARLYDAALGRFLSPDPYVQAPDFTQNFNRYSYCVNNPLVYVDEDGEFIHLIIGAVVGGTINVIANWKKIDGNFWKGLGYFGVGAAAGTLSAGVGAGISSALVSGGSFSAGFLGTAAAKTAATSFISGAAIGGGAGGTGGFITGFGNGLLGGKNFRQSLGQGALYGLGGLASGATIGGIVSGISAAWDGRNFFNGKGTSYTERLGIIQQQYQQDLSESGISELKVHTLSDEMRGANASLSRGKTRFVNSDGSIGFKDHSVSFSRKTIKGILNNKISAIETLKHEMQHGIDYKSGFFSKLWTAHSGNWDIIRPAMEMRAFASSYFRTGMMEPYARMFFHWDNLYNIATNSIP